MRVNGWPTPVHFNQESTQTAPFWKSQTHVRLFWIKKIDAVPRCVARCISRDLIPLLRERVDGHRGDVSVCTWQRRPRVSLLIRRLRRAWNSRNSEVWMGDSGSVCASCSALATPWSSKCDCVACRPDSLNDGRVWRRRFLISRTRLNAFYSNLLNSTPSAAIIIPVHSISPPLLDLNPWSPSLLCYPPLPSPNAPPTSSTPIKHSRTASRLFVRHTISALHFLISTSIIVRECLPQSPFASLPPSPGLSRLVLCESRKPLAFPVYQKVSL